MALPREEKLRRKRIQNAVYRNKNKKLIRERQTESRRINKEHCRAYNKARYLKKKDQILRNTVNSWRKRQVKAAGRPKPPKCEMVNCDGEGVVVLDHCHATGKVRGWICTHCNRALGLLRDNPALLRELANYLELDRPNATIVRNKDKRHAGVRIAK